MFTAFRQWPVLYLHWPPESQLNARTLCHMGPMHSVTGKRVTKHAVARRLCWQAWRQQAYGVSGEQHITDVADCSLVALTSHDVAMLSQRHAAARWPGRRQRGQRGRRVGGGRRLAQLADHLPEEAALQGAAGRGRRRLKHAWLEWRRPGCPRGCLPDCSLPHKPVASLSRPVAVYIVGIQRDSPAPRQAC